MVKKIMILSSSIIALLMSTSVAFAATGSSDEGNIFITEDGTEVYYDEISLNGAIDTSEAYKGGKVGEGDYKPLKGTRAPVKILNVSFQTQLYDNYCGPASASMIVKALGFNKSQGEMASILGTHDGGTDAGPSVATALNKVTSSKATFRWEWHNYLDINTIATHIQQAIDYGNAVMLNTMESPGDWYLSGHNTGYQLFHFGVVKGYNNYVGTGLYVDPAYGLFAGFVQEQNATWHDLSYASGGRGYAW